MGKEFEGKEKQLFSALKFKSQKKVESGVDEDVATLSSDTSSSSSIDVKIVQPQKPDDSSSISNVSSGFGKNRRQKDLSENAKKAATKPLGPSSGPEYGNNDTKSINNKNKEGQKETKLPGTPSGNNDIKASNNNDKNKKGQTETKPPGPSSGNNDIKASNNNDKNREVQ